MWRWRSDSVNGAVAYHRHGVDVNDDVGGGWIRGVSHDLLDHVFRQHHQQQAVVHRIAVEDLAVARGDDGLDAVLLQTPDGMLAAGAAAEVAAADEDGGAAVIRAVQDEIGARLMGAVEAHVVQQALVQAGFVDPAQELLRHDLVRVQVGRRQRRGDTFDAGVGGVRHGRLRIVWQGCARR
jgi:hypothetical protein